MRQFTLRQPPPDIIITTQEWKPDPEVIPKHDDLYARAWECEYEKPIFDAKNNNPTPPNSPEIPIQSNVSTEETWNTPGTAEDCSREVFFSNGRNIWRSRYVSLHGIWCGDKLGATKQQPDQPRSTQYNFRHNPEPNCNAITDINSCNALVCSTERVPRHSSNSKDTSRNQYVAVHKLF